MSLSFHWHCFLINSLPTPFSSGSHTISITIVSFPSIILSAYFYHVPYYSFAAIEGKRVGEQKADFLATFYDFGGIFGNNNNCFPFIPMYDSFFKNQYD